MKERPSRHQEDNSSSTTLIAAFHTSSLASSTTAAFRTRPETFTVSAGSPSRYSARMQRPLPVDPASAQREGHHARITAKHHVDVGQHDSRLADQRGRYRDLAATAGNHQGDEQANAT